ncbi:MAG: hypothetical protein JWN31_1354, partial [Frankiales bacterium]|nr:hypothetical protein [Frankiales bacterium]
PVTMGGLSFGVAEAAEHGVGVAQRADAVYVAAIIDHAQVAQPVVVAALRQHAVTAAVGAETSAPTPTDIRQLHSQQVTVVGVDLLKRSRNPRRLMASVRSAGSAVTAAGDADAKVVCVGTPGVLEHIQSWFSDVNLALPKVVLKGGQPLPSTLKLGDRVLLDEQGRSAAQVVADLDLVSRVLHSQGLAEKPMRALWPTP